MKERGWALRWNERGIEGYTDYFAPGDLDRPCSRLVHLVIGPRGWRGLAACRVEIDGPETFLDYTAYSEENRRAQMDLGTMTVVFSPRRENLTSVRWRTTDGIDRPVRVTTSIAVIPPHEQYRPKRGRLRSPVLQTYRGAQGRFRTDVRAAYGDRCAITGCDVSEALEAAHIDPYENPTQHHPCNGILLRKDLHALFDRTLIAIDPESSLVQVADAIQRYRDYARLHNKARLRLPQRGFQAFAPAASALQARWRLWLSLTTT